MSLVEHTHQIGKPRIGRETAKSDGSGSLVRPGLVFASFLLTLPSPSGRGRTLGVRWKTLMLRLQSPLLCLSSRRHLTTKLNRITKGRENVSPSPRGRGWGEGKQDTRSLDHVRFRLSIRKPPVGPHVFEPFIISSLRLCQRSLMICIPICSFSPSLTFTFLVANHVDDDGAGQYEHFVFAIGHVDAVSVGPREPLFANLRH